MRPIQTDDDSDDETGRQITHNRNVNETADPVRIACKIKRGTGTRDQDTHTLKVRADNPASAASDMSALVGELEQRDVFERVRGLQTEDNDE